MSAAAPSLRSAILEGRVRHRRKRPRVHAFEYRVWMTLLDVSEIARVFRGRWVFSDKRFATARYRRDDYLAPVELPLDQAVRKRVSDELGFEVTGRIEIVTNLRIFGYRQNPVTFYFCHAPERADDGGPRLEAIVAEITNTPWGERHAYVLDARDMSASRSLRFEFGKQFHVSPFMPMGQTYDWTFFVRDRRIVIHMRNLVDGECVFDATLNVSKQDITSRRIAWALLRYPFQTGRVVAGIYWQAFRLWLKRVPFYSHPETGPSTQDTENENGKTAA